MFVNWLRPLFTPTRPLSTRRPTFRPAVVGLEDRLAPAQAGTLSVVGNTLWYNGVNAINNVVTVDQPAAGQLRVTDAAGTINVAGIAGTGAGSGSVTVGIPSNVTRVIINAQSGTDIVNLGPLSTAATLEVVGENVNVTGDLAASAITFTLTPNVPGVITLAAGADLTTANTPNAGNITFNGPVVLAAGQHALVTNGVTDGNILFAGNVTGPGGLDVNTGGLTGAANSGGNFTVNGPMNISGALAVGAPGVTGANNVSLNQAANAATSVGLWAFNAIKLNGTVTTTGTVTLSANRDAAGSEGFTQTAGDVITSNATAGAILLRVNTGVAGTGSANVRGLVTGVGGTVTVNTSSPVGGGAVTDLNGPGVLNVSTGAGGSLVVLAGSGGVNLDTFTANVTANVTGALTPSHVMLRNSGLDLTVGAAGVATSNGSVSISNNINRSVALAGSVTATNGNVSITAGVPGQGATGSITRTAGVVTGNTVTLVAHDSIGTAAAPILTAAGNLLASTSLLTAVGGINVSNAGALNVMGASANSGPVNLTTTAGGLTVNGAVTTASGGAVTLTSAGAIDVNTGSVTSNTGAIVLSPTSNVRVATGTAVTTAGTITVTAPTTDTVIDIAGTVTGGGAVTVNGAGGALSTVVSVGGTLASGGLLTIDSNGTGASTFNLGGVLAGGGGVTIDGDGLTSLVMNGTLTSNGATTLAAGVDGGVIMTVSGVLNSAGAVTFTGATGAGTTFLNLTGTVMGGSTVAVTGGTTGALTVNQTGAVTGTGVTVTGSSGAMNVITLNGPVTATTGSVVVNSNSGALGSVIYILGKMTTPGGVTQVIGSATGADYVVAVPSNASAFNFTFGTGANILVVQAPLSAIVNTAGGTVDFTAASGFMNWGYTGAVTVSPVVP